MNRFNIGINLPKQSQILPVLFLARIAITVLLQNQIIQADKYFLNIENIWIIYLILIEQESSIIIMIIEHRQSTSYNIWTVLLFTLILLPIQIVLFAPNLIKDSMSEITIFSLWLFSISFISIINIFRSIISKVKEIQREMLLIYLGEIFIQMLYIICGYFTFYIEWTMQLLFITFYLSISLTNLIYFGGFLFEKYLLKLPGYNETLNFYKDYVSNFLKENESGYWHLYILMLLYIVDVIIVYAILDNWPPWMWIEICIFFISVTFTCLLYLNDRCKDSMSDKNVVNNWFAAYFQLQLYCNLYQLCVYLYPNKFEPIEILMRKY